MKQSKPQAYHKNTRIYVENPKLGKNQGDLEKYSLFREYYKSSLSISYKLLFFHNIFILLNPNNNRDLI